MGKGNKAIDKSMIKTIFEGNIIIPLPKVLLENRYHSMFSLISPTHCDFCGTKLNVNSHYTRSILTSYGTITCNITYWIWSLFNFFWFFSNFKRTMESHPYSLNLFPHFGKIDPLISKLIHFSSKFLIFAIIIR